MSFDTTTHLELYKCFARISGIVHMHSDNIGAFARGFLILRKMHADYLFGSELSMGWVGQWFKKHVN